MTTVLVLIASYNRKKKTLSCLSALKDASKKASISLTTFLVDASSSDGTTTEVAARFPEVQLVRVPETSYWASSMRTGWEHSQHVPRDYLLWLNDDVTLDSTALLDLLRCADQLENKSIVVGTTRDPSSFQVTYGGFLRGPWFKRLDLRRVIPDGAIQRADLANGNILLVPDAVDRFLGGFPKGFAHSMADLVFTNRARRRRVPIAVAPATYGTCAENAVSSPWRDSDLAREERLKLLLSPKGLPLNEWARVCFSLGGISAPLHFISPIMRAMR